MGEGIIFDAMFRKYGCQRDLELAGRVLNIPLDDKYSGNRFCLMNPALS